MREKIVKRVTNTAVAYDILGYSSYIFISCHQYKYSMNKQNDSKFFQKTILVKHIFKLKS